MVWQHTVALTQGSVMHITPARDPVDPAPLAGRKVDVARRTGLAEML